MSTIVLQNADFRTRRFIVHWLDRKGYSVITDERFEYEAVYIVDAESEEGSITGPDIVKLRRQQLPKALIIGISDRLNFKPENETHTIGEQLMNAGADAVWSKLDDPEKLLKLLSKEKKVNQRVAVVIDDAMSWQEIFVEELQKLRFEVKADVTYCDHPEAEVIIVDAQNPSGKVVGPEYVQRLRALHPQAFIVGASAALELIQKGATVSVQKQFIQAGANVTVNKDDFDNRDFRKSIP